MKIKIGFAITAFDKFEEAMILFDIIRKEFKGKYKISFCSNHPDGHKIAADNNLDNFTPGRNIPFTGGDIHRTSKTRDLVSIVLRSSDTVQRSCLAAMEMDVDYIVHMHSDAWCLSEEKIIELVNKMKDLKKKVAVRGPGIEYYISNHKFGYIDDHFFVFEKEYFQKKEVFNYKPEDFFPHVNTVHQITFINILTKVGLERIWYYRKTQDLLCYDEKKLIIPGVKPSSFDSYYMFLHVHRGSFPNGYGKSIQAMYLKEQDFNNSSLIKEFINENYVEHEKLMSILLKYENKINKRLLLLGYGQKILQNREIIYKENIIKSTTFFKLIKNYIIKFAKKIYSIKKHNTKINDISDFYRNVVKLDELVDDKWTKDLYYDINIE